MKLAYYKYAGDSIEIRAFDDDTAFDIMEEAKRTDGVMFVDNPRCIGFYGTPALVTVRSGNPNYNIDEIVSDLKRSLEGSCVILAENDLFNE